MNRKLSQQDSSASFDLMLDVLSNVFGGVILISCLLAILPRHKIPPPLVPFSIAKTELTERRIQVAEGELDKLRSQKAELEKTTDPEIAELAQQRQELENKLKALQDKIRNSEDRVEEAAEIKALLARGNEKDLSIRLQALKREILSEENKQKALKDEVKRHKERLRNMEKQLAEIKSSKPYSVRFPKEKAAGGNVFPIIVRYGRIYPLQIGDPLVANPDLSREIHPLNDKAVTVIPRRDKGWILPTEEIKLLETLRAVRAIDSYATIYLYPDSHKTFNDLKSQIFSANIDYGMEFIERDEHLIFSSEGASPPKL